MLEVKNLRKEYKTKNGVVTKALDDVSLTFPETGMIFILGKSGSGKSTLLNVCGGLDKADSGEIIIKGKSSKEFSGQDFDSYRNTYVGFVFQEYNVLDEFTVEENVALALELQNKKRDREVIARILADVEMSEYASRKPNTLSGGQKQRVAIARALVKEPEIIMADEPTGALDSKTGQQVFDTLKKLSKNKLVLVISHDREFAEQYGDRIVELKDGKVLSDVTRAPDDPDKQNVRFFGTDTVCVADGSKVTDGDLEHIRQFLSKAGGTAVISTSREKIAELKKDLPELSAGSFENTETQPVSREYPKQNLIRSKFPLKHAIKMGGSSLKSKPVRLVFTMFLSVIAFVLFGLASTAMLYNDYNASVNSFMNSDYSYVNLGKGYYITKNYYHYGKLEDSYVEKENSAYTFEEYDELSAKYPGVLAFVDKEFNFENVRVSSNAQQFYGHSYRLVIANSSLNMLGGSVPTAVNEVAISDFIFDSFKTGEFTQTVVVTDDSGSEKETSEKVELNTYADIIGKELEYYSNYPKYETYRFKITGVYKGNEMPSKYQSLKNNADRNGEVEWNYNWSSERDSGLYARVAVCREFFTEYADLFAEQKTIDGSKYFIDSAAYIETYYGTEDDRAPLSGNSMARLSPDWEKRSLPVYALGGARLEALSSGTVAVSNIDIGSVYERALREVYDSNLDENGIIREWTSKRDTLNHELGVLNMTLGKMLEANENDPGTYTTEQIAEAQKAVYEKEAELTELGEKYSEKLEHLNEDREKYDSLSYHVQSIREMRDYVKWYADREKEPDLGWDALEALSEEKAATYIRELSQFLDDYSAALPVVTFRSNKTLESAEVTIVGYYFWNGAGSGGVYYADDLYDKFYEPQSQSWYWEYETKYVENEDALISAVLVPYDHSRALTSELIGLTRKRADDDSTTLILNPLMGELDLVSETVSELGTVFLWVGVVLALFAFLLMFNFISASISAKKKEIGILRAIGARTLDVFKVFLSEAYIIALICFVLSTVGSALICFVLNTVLMAETVLTVTLFVFGPLSVLCIFGITLLTATLATVIPVALYSRKPPVESIRAL